jgi:predicted aspartyl protease
MRPNNVPFFTLWCASMFFCFLPGAHSINSSEASQDALYRPQNSDLHHQSAADLTESSKVTLERLIEEKRYPELEKQLPSATLGHNERLYFEGILADRLNQPSHAIELLEEVLPELMKSDHRRAVIALNALGQDYFMMGRYSQATKQYAIVLRSFTRFLDRTERRIVQNYHDGFALLGNASPQSISGQRSVTVTTRRNALGYSDVPLRIGSNIEWWLWDTGSSISTVTKSTARRLGLKASEGRAQAQSGTGTKVPVSTAIIPELTLGTVIIHNVAVAVMDDKELKFDRGTQGTYQINGLLGYPVLAALESLTVTGDEMQVGPSEIASSGTTRLYVEEFTPMLAASSGKETLMFVFDTGNDGMELTARFLKRFPQKFASLKSERKRIWGVGGTKALNVY